MGDVLIPPQYYDCFGKSYFDGGAESLAYTSYTDSWIWPPIAEILLYFTESGPILDWGCAKGYLVQKFVERGVNAYGVDVSEYAISKAPTWMVGGRVKVIDGVSTPFPDRNFHTVCSFETMEHIPESLLPEVIGEMKRVSEKWWVGSIFLDSQVSGDPTHVTVKSREWWNRVFRKQGWAPREDLARRMMKYPVFKALGYQIFCFTRE